VIFGPKPRDFNVKMNRKERRLALRTALQSRAEDLVIVENFAAKFSQPKTKELVSALSRWGIKQGKQVILILSDISNDVYLSARNVSYLKLLKADSLNVYDLLAAEKIVTTPEALSKIQEVYSD
ncbi:MAG: 50S ribosomal protein L4, partial [cyanobacterium endosymbiont of Rhopalodia inflata]